MRTLTAAIVTIFLFVCTGHLMGANVQVGTCRKGVPTFATIQAAVTASSAGGAVLVCPGTYPEQVTIDKPLPLLESRTEP